MRKIMLTLSDSYSKRAPCILQPGAPHSPYKCLWLQGLVTELLQEMLNTFVVVYIDYIFIYTSSGQKRVKDMHQVLQDLIKNHLINHRSIMPFLGYIHDTQWVKMDESMDEELTSFPQPQR